MYPNDNGCYNYILMTHIVVLYKPALDLRDIK